ncbi:hypothetical protein OEZ85_004482 [Tetradesmus obliquus]|uniref:Phospholipase/carboxylesterase/thioesterase domain-containing protein n=1 Tax=Tetradesmus obliquus TaxID=3088 RepID=A0ABY8UP48_TETOB|nr:hypothetical protein OEZ85_004482 [Tetradesmus obliquus]
MPAAAVDVCCGDIAAGALDAMSPSHLAPTGTADLLQIAVNCSSQGVAAAAIDRLVFIQCSVSFSDLEPAAVCRILSTAALRQHASVIESLASLPGVEDAVDPHTLEEIFKHLISCHEDTCTALLEEWPAAVQTLSTDAVARLILHALDYGLAHTHDRGFAAELMRKPAAAQLSSGTLADIITASILQHNSELVACACEAPAAQQITREVVFQLLQAGLQQGSGVSVLFLCSLPAAQQLNSSELFGLLRLAVQQSKDPPKNSSEDAGAAELTNEDCMMQLLLLPAAFQVTSNEVARLLQAAVQLGSSGNSYLYVPPTYNPSLPSPLLVMLHGAGGHGPNTLATGSFGPDVAHINSSLQYVFERYSVDPSRLGLAGFSDGASYALSLGLPNGDLFSHIICFSPGFMRPPCVSHCYSVDPSHLGIAGFSDGASYALSLGLPNGDLFSHINAFSPGFMRPPCVAGSPKVYISHGVHDEVLPIDRCSRRLLPSLKQMLPQGELHYVEFNGPHVVPAGISQEALLWFTNGQAPVTPN